MNEGDESATFVIVFVDSNGESHVGSDDSLNVGGSIALDATSTSHFNLNDGLYTAFVYSTQKLSSVVRIYDEETQTLSLYRGTPESSITNTLYFGPFFKSTEKNSTVYLLNTDSIFATVEIQALTAVGEVADTISESLIPAGGATISADALDLPADFTGWLRVSANQPLAGLLAPTSQTDQIGLYPPVAFFSTQRSVRLKNLPDMPPQPYADGPTVSYNFLQRAYNDTILNGGLRNTHIFFGNLAATSLQFQGTMYEFAKPNSESGHVQEIPGQGFQYLSLSKYFGLGSAFTGSLIVASDDPLALGELTESVGGDLLASYGSYLSYSEAYAGLSLIMPYVAHDSERSSILTVQNLGGNNADVTVNFVDQSGANELTLNLNGIEPNRSEVIRTAEQPRLADGFVGSVVITSDSRISATFDEFLKVKANSPMPTATFIPTATPTVTPMPTLTDTVLPNPPPTATPTPSATPPGPFSISVNVSVPITQVTVGEILTVTTSLETEANGCSGDTMDLTLSGMNELFIPISATRVSPSEPFVLEAQTPGTTTLCVNAFGDHSCGNGAWYHHNFGGCSEPISVVASTGSATPTPTPTALDPPGLSANDKIFLPFIRVNE
ncbi:hypothetical protein KFU94_14400 [Chloroflexi bacterium TSY]|nr:hypothetical protein [Chloroflexi bacterium TSY]